MEPGVSEFNPPLRSKIHNVAGKRVTVIRDDFLDAGTKQRYLPVYMSQPKFEKVTEFIYAGSSDGYGQVGIAYAAKILGKKATIFIQRWTPGESEQTQLARKLGAHIKGPYRESIHNLKKRADAYVRKSKTREWGLATDSRDTEAIDILASQIKAAFDAAKPKRKSLQKKPGKIFVVAGTAIIYTALKKVFPDTKFIIVQVGKKIWPDQVYEGDEIFVSPFKFTELPPEDRVPPYPTVLNYDAKVYDAVSELGNDGDWIWNIAG